MILYTLYRIGVFLALLLPLNISYAVAGALAKFYCVISTVDRETVTANLRVVTGGAASDKELAVMTREVFKNFAKYLVDFFRFSVIDEKYIKQNVRISGAHNIDSALAKGKGAIILSAHVGNWELGGIALPLSGYPLSAVVLTHQNKKINDFFTSQRLRGKLKPIEIGASLRACYRTLKKNGLLALLGDRDFTKNGLMADFFGKKTHMPKGPAIFAYREGAAILPTFITRNPDDTFNMVIHEPIYADPTLSEEDSVAGLAAQYIKKIEQCVRSYPTQWYVFKNLWENNGKESLRPDTIL